MEKKVRHNYKNLKIWIIAMEIANDIFEITSKFPLEEKYSLTSQINRCAVSIPSNIAEGSARTNKSFSHFIDISLGSSFELVTQLIISQNRNYISQQKLEEMEYKIEEFPKMSFGFLKTL
ncbi:MAG: four helix bundle protein [Flavobacteriales bacterium]|nr:four helix bundle protein [Flavobacteriales bacterium]